MPRSRFAAAASVSLDDPDLPDVERVAAGLAPAVSSEILRTWFGPSPAVPDGCPDCR